MRHSSELTFCGAFSGFEHVQTGMNEQLFQCSSLVVVQSLTDSSDCSGDVLHLSSARRSDLMVGKGPDWVGCLKRARTEAAGVLKYSFHLSLSLQAWLAAQLCRVFKTTWVIALKAQS